MQLIVRITKKRNPNVVLGEVKVPMGRGADWARQARSAGVMAWRRNSGDYATSVVADIIPAEEAAK